MTKELPKVQAACSARSEFLMPVLFIAIGGICLWQSQGMSQLGAIFPVTIAIVTIVSGLLRLGQLMLRGVSSNTERERGSTPRRVLMVLAMAAWAFIMPWAGFLLAGLVSFVTLMMIAQYKPWTPRRLMGHLISGILLVAFFYGLFALLLNVPLPVGRWWM
ncbi:tripartite tricarboxylate transporter TctB family protein [Halomonas sediminis]